MKNPRPLEKEVLKQCRQYLELRGFFVMRLNSGAVAATYKGKRRYVRFNDMPGCADLLCVRDGKAVFVECKRPGGKVSLDQHAFKDAVQRHGGVWILADGIDSLQRDLEAHGL